MPAPKLDKRTFQNIVADCEALAGIYTPDWSGVNDARDPGRGLIELFARLQELLLERFNRIPEKNFLSFLDLVGVDQFAGRPAEAPVTFLLSRKAPAGALVPAGTQVATTQTQNADAKIFETRRSFFATPAKVQKVVNLVPPADAFSEIPPPALPPGASEAIADPSRAIVSLAGDASSLQPVEHALYVGSEALFGRKEPVDVSLTLALSGGNAAFAAANLEWKRYSSKDGKWVALDPPPAHDLSRPGQVTITLRALTGIEKSAVGDVEDFWLAGCFTADPGAVTPPRITAVTGAIVPPANPRPAVRPDTAFNNANRLDLSKPFLPFGRRPAYGDAFYFSSAAAFAPEVASVTLTFTIRPYSEAVLKDIFANITADTTVSTTVDWQYLDAGGAWQTLVTHSHNLNVTKGAPVTIAHDPDTTSEKDGVLFGSAGASTAVVKLTGFPDDIALREVNGERNYWLRALLKTENPYGADAFVPANTPAPVVVGPTFIPPVVEKLEIVYEHRDAPIGVAHVRTGNNFETVAHVPDAGGNVAPFSPFLPLRAHTVQGVTGIFAQEPALYVGFDAPFGQGFISLFIHLADTVSAATFPLETGDPQIAWEYLNPALEWKPLDVNDGTEDLRTSGVVGFLAPEDSAPLSLFPLLFPPGKPAAVPALYWYRARLRAGQYDHPPQVLGLYLNTVMADNRITHRQDPTTGRAELLVGSATGEQNQAIDLIQRPVLSGALWVREPEIPSPLELRQLLDEFLESEDEISPAAVEDLYEQMPEGAGGEREVWVRWKRAANFLSSKPRSRHYTLDAVAGTLTFGDGNRGLIPTAGKDNLVLRGFQTGGGEEANRSAAALAIKEMKTSLPFVDKVWNVQKAEGGSNPWSLEETLRFGPQIVKNRGRAVTREDYEWMVRQEFSQVARVRCLATRKPAPGGGLVFQPGAVTLVIVPKSTERLPEPSQRLLTGIRQFLAGKTLGNIASGIFAVGPNYRQVYIEATVVPKRPEEASLIGRRVARALEEFLHPLTGGEAGAGWEFGRSVFLSEIFAVMERTEGVDHVVSARFPEAPLDQAIAVGENSLAASGTHAIHIG